MALNGLNREMAESSGERVWPKQRLFEYKAQTECLNDPKHRCAALTGMTESVPNNVQGIQRFCSHIMEIPTTHRAVLIPHGRTHTPTPIIFHSLSLSFFHLLFFVWFSNLQYLSCHVFGHWAFFSEPYIFICHLVFSLLAALFQDGSTLTRHFFQSYLSNPFSVFLLYFSVSHVFSSHMSRLLLSSSWVGDGHWVLRPGDKGPPTFSRWLGLCLICRCHPHWQKHKSPALRGPPLHPLTQTVTPINQIPHFMLLSYDCTF